MKTYPVDNILDLLMDSLLRNNSIVLQAPPGAGKTTRVPLALLDVIPEEAGRIVMLEPRRIAATSAARWMAATLGEEVGGTVGYSIRFDRRVSQSTRIEVVTEGILTRRIQSDPGLEGIAMIIFDEFHERSLQADLSLALCLDIQRGLRNDLKLLIMSATLDPAPVARLLGDAPVVTTEGRTYPVEERYLPDDREHHRLADRTSHAVARALKETRGDILVFLPGAGEIRACADLLRQSVSAHHITFHPLYGDLSFEEQERAIMPSEMRKIVLATNIAETSLTIEGVQVVVDSGLARRLQYDPSSGMNRLVTVPISKASAEQRKGRAGRTAPGVCYRLYSRYALETMVPYAPPEISVSDLSSVVLELAVWGVKDPSKLAWLDVPPAASWESARALLTALGALDRHGSVTAAGRKMAGLPLHPRLGRLLVRADELGAPRLGADLAALLSERDILRRNVPGMDEEPDVSDRLEILRRWRRDGVVPSVADAWALRVVDKTARHLLREIRRADSGNTDEAGGNELISRLLLDAFPDRIAKLREDGEGRYVLSQGRGVRFIRPGTMAGNRFIVALNVDAGEKAEGVVHLAASLTEELIRSECGGLIEKRRRVDWDSREGRIVSSVEERLGAVSLSQRPFRPSDEETVPVLCAAIRSDHSLVVFRPACRQFLSRVCLMKRTFPEEDWPDLSEDRLAASPEEWLLPWLKGIRNAKDLAALDILAALRARLTWAQLRLLEQEAPTHLAVPSGSRVALDYSSGDLPVLAVKLQEMFGLADTPTVAGGRVKVLLHLLSPARRPVQITQDLRGFWNSGYLQVKKELKGRYPKHPWPDDPWNAPPTRRLKPKGT